MSAAPSGNSPRNEPRANPERGLANSSHQRPSTDIPCPNRRACSHHRLPGRTTPLQYKHKLLRRHRRRFKRTSALTPELILSMTPRQAVVWLLNLEAVGEILRDCSGEPLSAATRAQLEEVLRSLAKQDRIPTPTRT